MDRARLKAELERDEGRKLIAYKDTAKVPVWTIGIGHALNTGPTPRVERITDRECDAWYEMDAADAEALARECVAAFDTLTDDRQRALVNMAFNRGGHMKSSTTITPAINAAVTSGDWAAVRAAIEASEWASQVKGRAARLADQLA